jgi:acetylornithine deacetylase/succinyl-diaminopimelate desuccinylase-like protein
VTFCRQESVSQTGAGIQATAVRVAEAFQSAGAQTELLAPASAYPLVLGTLGAGPRTLLLYDHYDVQPPGPLAAWHSPPFEPECRGGVLVGRGVGDDKGELLARLQALQAYQHVFGELPLQVRFLVEGAHEIGSVGLREAVEANRDKLQADACLSEGLGSAGTAPFTLYLGCRGLAYVELTCHARENVIASMHGGLVLDPGAHLAKAISSLFTDRGQLVLDGLVEWVAAPTPIDVALLEGIPPGARPDVTQPGEAPMAIERLRQHLFEPAAAVCAFVAGNPEWGLVMPGQATARLDIRLVSKLLPETAQQLVRQHLDKRGFSSVQVRLLGGVAPDRCPLEAPIVTAARHAAEAVTGHAPVVYPLMPAYSVAHVFHDILATPVLFAGAVTHSGSNLHAPNENIRLSDYFGYMRYFGRLIKAFAEIAH